MIKEIKEEIIELILTRFTALDNGRYIRFVIDQTPDTELTNFTEEVSLVQLSKIKFINEDKIIEIHFGITEHESNDYARVLAEIIKQEMFGHHLEEMAKEEPVDSDGPITYHYITHAKADVWVNDIFFIDTE